MSCPHVGNCYGCREEVCEDCIIECDRCGNFFCLPCMDSGQLCLSCAEEALASAEDEPEIDEDDVPY